MDSWMNGWMFAVTWVGFVAAGVVLIEATLRARVRAVYQVPWIIGLVVMGVGVAFTISMSVGTILEGGIGGSWIILGVIAKGLVLWTAFLQPRWAGWVLVCTAVVAPIIGSGIPWLIDSSREVFPVFPLAGFYSLPAIVTGALLILSTGQFIGEGQRVEQEEVSIG